MFISGQFLQSKEWEDFQKSIGRKTFRVDDILLIKLPLKAGFYYLYCPKNIIPNLKKITKLAKSEKAVFIRMEPEERPKIKFTKTRDIQPACTSILDLTKSEEELLSAMKQKTRYNIRLADKKNVKVKEDDFDNFYKLISETYSRQNIRLHKKEYYKKLSNFNKIFTAYYNNKPIASAMINLNNKIATYLHGGSTQEEKNIMAPYLLHWEIIKHYKKAGAKYYDWWGIDENKWPGITRFKRGFGGKEICTPGTIDIPIKKLLYTLYKLLRN